MKNNSAICWLFVLVNQGIDAKQKKRSIEVKACLSHMHLKSRGSLSAQARTAREILKSLKNPSPLHNNQFHRNLTLNRSKLNSIKQLTC